MNSSIVAVPHSTGEIRMDSRLLASRFGNKHKNVLTMLDEYATEFAAFGALAFETEVRPAQEITRGGLPARYAMLNEDQCIFLLTLARNSPLTIELKVRLVQAFRKARDLLTPPTPDFSNLERLAGLTAQALTVVRAEIVQQVTADIAQVRTDISSDMDAKIGSLQATSEQQHDVKRLVKLVVSGRQRLSLANAIFASVYRECWDACRIGNLPSMTRVQYPQAVAFLRTELSRLAALGDSGLFGDDSQGKQEVQA